MGEVNFYSSIRQGAALAITRQDSTTPPNPAVERVQLPVTLSYPAEPSAGGTAGTTLALLGPGDIVGLDTRTIVRTFPLSNDNEAEAGFLCYVDFDQADLPWRYTPAANAGSILQHTDQLRPWLTLIVLAEGTEFATTDFRPAQGDEKLPQLTVANLGLLPADLSLAWAWAHVQAQTVVSDSALPTTLAGPPGAMVARLLSPRQLAPNTAYTAFLVPTFAGGVAAGQGKTTSGLDGLTPAWGGATSFPLQLPVYYSWRFQTGSVSSFRQAVSELRPVATLPDTVGVREMDVSNPGLSLSPPTSGPLPVGGALQTPEQAVILDPALETGWLDGIGSLVDLGAAQTPPVVTPPIYGRWYAAQDHLDYPSRPGNPTNPPWLSLLNQDPRFRVAAGLGTEVVQRDLQALLAAAQEQASVLVDTVNRRRKVLQAGREVFTRLVSRHLNTGSGTATASMFFVTALLHGKILSCTGGGPPTPTIGGILTGTPFGGFVYPWRRPFPDPAGPLIGTINTGGFIPQPNTPDGMATPPTIVGGAVPGGLPDGGITTIINTMSSDQRLYWGVVIFWVARKLLSTQAGKYWWLLRRLLRLGLDLIQLASTQGVSSVTILEKLRAGTLQSGDIRGLPPASNFTSVTQDPILSDPNTWPTPRPPTTTPGSDSTQAQAFKTALEELLDFVNGALPGRSMQPADVPGLVTCILNSLSPAVTFVAYEQAIHVRTRTIAWQAPDPLEPILLPPTVSFPMWHRLAEISADWILPNVGDVPRNSVSLLETNQKFIEAFMVGLNHHVNRELLWNGYPTDQRGTIFQQFWDPSGWVDGNGSGDRSDSDFLDITEVRSWGATSPLGSHTGRNPDVEHLVLLVRGDVIKRYPNAVVYAAKADLNTQTGAITINDSKQVYPVFQAVLTGDVAYYGFELTQDQARGSSTDGGYYFVLQEHPSEPKFNDLGQPPPKAYAVPTDYNGQNDVASVAVAADLAAAAFEHPTRAAILGRDLLPPSS